MISVKHKADPFDYALVEQYRDHQAGAQYHGDEWQSGLLPFWSWGCAMYSCVDCNDPTYRIHHSDHCDTHPKKYNLDEFFEMWLAGVCILDCDAAPRKSAVIINPFTGKKFRVTGARKKKKK